MVIELDPMLRAECRQTLAVDCQGTNPLKRRHAQAIVGQGLPQHIEVEAGPVVRDTRCPVINGSNCGHTPANVGAWKVSAGFFARNYLNGANQRVAVNSLHLKTLGSNRRISREGGEWRGGKNGFLLEIAAPTLAGFWPDLMQLVIAKFI